MKKETLIYCPNCHEPIRLRVVNGKKQINLGGKWISYRDPTQQTHNCPRCSETVYECPVESAQ